MIKAVIFDLDGVVTDTAEYHYQAWKQLADEEGLDFDRTVNEKLRGVSRTASLKIILTHNQRDALSPEKMDLMTDRKNRYYQALLTRITPDDYLPGAKEVVVQLRNKGIITAIASASKNAKSVIDSLKGNDLFDYIADGFSVSRSKPAPDLFLHVAEHFSLDPKECVVVEDAQAGIEAALAGGMYAVGVGPEERVGKAHLRYENTSFFDASQILDLGRE